MAADTLTAMLLGGIMRRPLTSTHYDFDDYVKTCVKIYLKGLQRDPGAADPAARGHVAVGGASRA